MRPAAVLARLARHKVPQRGCNSLRCICLDDASMNCRALVVCRTTRATRALFSGLVFSWLGQAVVARSMATVAPQPTAPADLSIVKQFFFGKVAEKQVRAVGAAVPPGAVTVAAVGLFRLRALVPVVGWRIHFHPGRSLYILVNDG